MSSKLHILFFFLLPVWASLPAQSPYFKLHTLGEDWNHARVEMMYEDRASLLWFGTSEGLFQYDGLNFLPLLKEDSTSSHVTAIYEDRQGILWAGYQDGSIYRSAGKNKLVPWLPEEGTPKEPIRGFLEDEDGTFWFATYGEGLYCVQDGRMYNFNADDGLLGNDIYDMESDPYGRIWVGTDNGISICWKENDVKRIENLTREEGLPDEIVKSLLRDKEGDIWIGTYDGGFCKYDFSARTFRFPFQQWQHGVITDLALFEGEDLWVGTEGDGLYRFRFDHKKVYPVTGKEIHADAKVFDLHKDIEGNIWIIDNKSGICSANRQFEFSLGVQAEVQALVTDHQNRTWVGTSDGLFLHRIQEDGSTRFLPVLTDYKLNVVSVYEDKFGDIWIGTFGEGLYIYSPEDGRIKHITEKEGLINRNVLSIDGKDDRVWLATLGGAVEYRCTQSLLEAAHLEHRDFTLESGLGTNFIYKVFVDGKGRTWFGTDGEGLSMLDNGSGSFVNYTHARIEDSLTGKEQNIPLNAVYSITEDHRGHIWLSTATEGIFEFDGEHFHHLAVKEGIRSLAITSLITSFRGDILIVHPSGIDLLQPASKHLIYYDDEVGIHEIDPHLNAVCSDMFGNIWIGVEGGLVKYTPLQEELSIHPRTILQGVSISLEPHDYRENRIFSHHQNSLVFNYVGLWYTDPSTVKYKYFLEGFNHDWIYSSDRQAVYPNLPPGDYVFKVTSTENEAFADEPLVTYGFEIRRPFWAAWWFISVTVLGAGLIVFWFIKAREKRLLRYDRLEKEKIESQFEALKSQINPHFLFNSFNTLVTIIEENPRLAVEYVERFSDFFRNMMVYREKDLISLQDELEVVHQYTFLLQRRYGDNLKLDIQLNGNQAKVAPLTLQMLVENAVKHNVISKSKPLTIVIREEDPGYISVVNNLQEKLTRAPSTGFGLQNIISRYALLSNKAVKVEKNSEIFKVSIPLLRNQHTS